VELAYRVKSSLALTRIDFPAYKLDELFDILKDRVKLSFRSGTISGELVKIVSVAAKGDDELNLKS